MKKLVAYFTLCTCFLYVSCIKSELPNSEADILSCMVDSEIIKKDPIIQNDRIQIFVKSFVDLTNQAPIFTLTPGATISPKSGTNLDFTRPQFYTVTSEDGKSQKKYQVSYITSALGAKYNFDNVRLQDNRYDVFYQVDPQGQNIMDWASGNAGFSLTGAASSPQDYPTSRLMESGQLQGVKLVTRSTGALGALMRKPLAAGNIFMGEFDVSSSINSPLKSLRLGMPVDFMPFAFKGVFKYTPGPVYKQGSQVVPDKIDSWDGYAIFFQTDSDLKYLDGTNKFTHSNVIAIAQISADQRIQTQQWTRFHAPFIYKDDFEFDPDKLAQGLYSLTIVLTSSKDGDYFFGAENSTLLIDEIEILYE
ncbi:PCMD domain-containing protein [Myroides sp. LJL119]